MPILMTATHGADCCDQMRPLVATQTTRYHVITSMPIDDCLLVMVQSAVSGQLEAAYKHMNFLGLMTYDEKEAFSSAFAAQDFPAACTQLCLLPVTRARLQGLCTW
jgi:hypothetical protein